MKYGLNLGCGTRIFKSNEEIQWLNLDATKGPGVDVVLDWRFLPALFSLYPELLNNLDLIISHHTFEHQGCGEQPIKECYEVLKPGGSLIVSVPDLWLLADLWKMGKISTQVYMTNIYGPYDGTEESRHRWGFDHDSLVQTLADNAQWNTIKPFDWRPIPGADIAYDPRWILCLEAIK